MAEPDFVLSIQEEAEFKAYAIQRGAKLVRDGMSLDSAAEAIREFGDQWLAEWRYEQTKKGPDFRPGKLAKRAFDSEAAKQNTPSTPPVYGGEEFAPGEVENEGAIVTNLLGYLIPVLGQIIDADFSPASVIKGARDSIASLRAIRRGEGPNEYGILTQAIKQATGAAPFGWRQSDLDQAAAMLIEMIRLQLGQKDEAPRDLSGKSYLELVAGATGDNVFARLKGIPKTPAESSHLVARGIGNREPRIKTVLVKNGVRGKRGGGVVGVREAVLNTLGIKTPAGYHEIQVEVR